MAKKRKKWQVATGKNGIKFIRAGHTLMMPMWNLASAEPVYSNEAVEQIAASVNFCSDTPVADLIEMGSLKAAIKAELDEPIALMRGVVETWEHGDLATAVRLMDEYLRDREQENLPRKKEQNEQTKARRPRCGVLAL